MFTAITIYLYATSDAGTSWIVILSLILAFFQDVALCYFLFGN